MLKKKTKENKNSALILFHNTEGPGPYQMMHAKYVLIDWFLMKRIVISLTGSHCDLGKKENFLNTIIIHMLY